MSEWITEFHGLAFELRFALLLGLAALVAGVDRLRHGAEARKWREYALLLACGLTGAAFGALFDQLTVTISSDYFLFGKGVVPGSLGMRGAVARLGAQAGLFAGLVSCGGLLLAGGARIPPGVEPELWRRALRPLPFALLGALLFGPLTALLDPWSRTPELVAELELDVAGCRRFLAVQGAHFGLYLGAVIGLFDAIRRLRRDLQAGEFKADDAGSAGQLVESAPVD